MSTGDFPTMMAMTYGSAAAHNVFDNSWGSTAELVKRVPGLDRISAAVIPQNIQPNPPQGSEPMSERRLVRVVMVDPHEHVPTEMALLYDSKELFTDKTDQELYFDMPVAELLKTHNDKRTKLVDKSVKERTQYLDAARIRDLKMLVITLAKF